MSTYLDVPVDADEPHIRAALTELRGLVAARWPDAVFTVYRGDDPDGIYLTPIVDIDDLDEVIDAVLPRMVELQEAGLPVYVVPDWPPERVQAHLRQKAASSLPIERLLPIG